MHHYIQIIRNMLCFKISEFIDLHKASFPEPGSSSVPVEFAEAQPGSGGVPAEFGDSASHQVSHLSVAENGNCPVVAGAQPGSGGVPVEFGDSASHQVSHLSVAVNGNCHVAGAQPVGSGSVSVQMEDNDMMNSINSCISTISLNEFLRTTVLSSLSPNSRGYSLLKEFVSLPSPDVGSAISAVNISEHIPVTGGAVSLSVPQMSTLPASVPLDSDEYVSNSNDSDMSVEIPVIGLSGLVQLNANTAEECENDSDTLTSPQNQQQSKRYFCLYCDKPYVKVKQHLISQHSEACEVAEMLSKDKDMQKYLLRLRNLGNHKHNCDVLSANKGTLVVAYTPNGGTVSIESAANYVPCPMPILLRIL